MKTPICIILALASAFALADQPAPSPAEKEAAEAEQLRQDLHRMRVGIEQEQARAESAARNNTLGLQLSSIDAPGIGQMKAQLSESMEKLASRCIGMEAKAVNGNVIVICGDNTGTAENSNVRNGDDNTVIVLPPPPAPAQTQENDHEAS